MQLRSWADEQPQQRLTAGQLWHETGLVVTTDVGTLWDPDNARKALRPVAAAIGAPGVVFHGLRHAAATLLLEEGVPVKVASELLGHSSTRVTEGIYAHVTQRLVDEAHPPSSEGSVGSSPAAPRSRCSTRCYLLEPAGGVQVADQGVGSRGRTRTFNLPVNSRTLCRLSYAGRTSMCSDDAPRLPARPAHPNRANRRRRPARQRACQPISHTQLGLHLRKPRLDHPAHVDVADINAGIS